MHSGVFAPRLLRSQPKVFAGLRKALRLRSALNPCYIAAIAPKKQVVGFLHAL